jgi:uncharacterized protein
MERSILFWRRTDVPGLERMELCIEADGVTAASTVLCAEEGGYRLDHRWRLDRDWHVRCVTADRWNVRGHATLTMERQGNGWRVDGAARPDLDGASEPDLSATPFCNTFPIRRLLESPDASLSIATAYIDASSMIVARSRQRYEKRGHSRLRYIDLGLSAGFEADLVVDATGLVVHYEHLFERLSPTF